MDGPPFADPLDDQANSSIIDSSSSFIFRVSFPDFDKLICARSSTNITCVDLYEEPFVIILVV
jgi:hypothetical protein